MKQAASRRRDMAGPEGTRKGVPAHEQGLEVPITLENPACGPRVRVVGCRGSLV